MSWTLQYIDAGGTTQNVTFAQLAALEGGKVVADAWQAKFQSHKASTVTLRLPGVPPHIAPAIPFESRVKLIGPTGTVQFAGLRTDRSGTANPRQSSSSYQFDDEWYFLDHCPFQQSWLRVTDTSGDTSIVPFTNVVLYQPEPGRTYSPAPISGLINTGQQIVDILNWAISQGANLQIGQIDAAIYQAWYPVQNIKCGDALRMCLRLHPDCFTEIDYSTTPPTFHLRKRANLAGVLLPYSYTDSAGRRHTATEMQPRPELQPKRVALFYRVIENNYLLSSPVDIWPMQNLPVVGPVISGQSVGGASAPYTVGGTPVAGTAMTSVGAGTSTIPVGAPGGLRALDFTIDLQGPKLSISNASITTAPFDPTDLNWWRQKIPSLRRVDQEGNIPNDGSPGALTLLSTSVNTGGAADISVLDATTVDAHGYPNNPTNISAGNYAFELVNGSPMGWMTASIGGPLKVIEVTVTAHFSYIQQTPGSTPVQISSQLDKKEHVRIRLCNSASISQRFTQAITTGEAIPPNLAQSVYNALAVLQYSFTHTLVERPFNGWLKPGKHAINLNGGAPAWTTMNATLQSSEYKMHLDGAGNTFDNFSVKCGPVEFLEPGQLVQIFNVFANRDLTKVDTNERLSGTPSPGNTIAMPSDTAQENSVGGQNIEQQAVQLALTTPSDPTSAPVGQINSDAGLIATILGATTPTPVSGATSTSIKIMQPREIKVCDDSGNPYYIIIHATDGYTKP